MRTRNPLLDQRAYQAGLAASRHLARLDDLEAVIALTLTYLHAQTYATVTEEARAGISYYEGLRAGGQGTANVTRL